MKDWPLWEVFIRSQHGLAHKHAGSLHAPDAEMAMKNARDAYTNAARRGTSFPVGYRSRNGNRSRMSSRVGLYACR